MQGGGSIGLETNELRKGASESEGDEADWERRCSCTAGALFYLFPQMGRTGIVLN